jgi:hypothetical protein
MLKFKARNRIRRHNLPSRQVVFPCFLSLIVLFLRQGLSSLSTPVQGLLADLHLLGLDGHALARQIRAAASQEGCCKDYTRPTMHTEDASLARLLVAIPQESKHGLFDYH